MQIAYILGHTHIHTQLQKYNTQLQNKTIILRNTTTNNNNK